MSRPSRGFSVHKCAPSSSPSCPTAAVIDVGLAGDDEWDVETHWAPSVTVVTLSLYGSINGGPYFLISTQGPVIPDREFIINPQTYGDDGDSLSLRVEASDVVGCPDFVSNVVTNTIVN